VGGVVAVVAAVAGTVFLISRVGSTTEGQPVSPTVGASNSSAASPPRSVITSPAVTSATATATVSAGAGRVAPPPPPRRSTGRTASGTSATTPRGTSTTGASATASTSAVGTAATPKTTPPLLPATAIGLDGTYRLNWRITAESIVPGDVSRLGKTGTLTFVASRDCTRAGCRTTVVGDIFPIPPGDAGAWSRSSRTETITCRAVGTGKPTGGTWDERVVNTSKMTAHQGNVVTAGTITQRLVQVRLCPTQTAPPVSGTTQMTFERIGP
jgi:hypothetical protein